MTVWLGKTERIIPTHTFQATYITQERLHAAYFAIKRNAASGVDGETWKSYGEKRVATNLENLAMRIHIDRYKPQPSKRIWIPKANGQERPIGIAALEDKIVQQALVWIIQSIYEEDFIGFSYGFRPKRSQHNALDALVAHVRICVGGLMKLEI